MNRVQGKTCIVTGGAVGIGHACVRRLSEEGAAVAIFDRQDTEGQALADAITHAGGNARYWNVDVSNEAAMAARHPVAEAEATSAALEARVAALEADVAALREQLALLQASHAPG